MRVLAFTAFFALLAIAYGFWPFSTTAFPAGDTASNPLVEPRPTFQDFHRSSKYNPEGFILYIRRDLSALDLIVAHKLRDYKECGSFYLNQVEFQVHLETCVKYFSSLDHIYDHYIKVKKEIADWEKKYAQVPVSEPEPAHVPEPAQVPAEMLDMILND